MKITNRDYDPNWLRKLIGKKGRHSGTRIASHARVIARRATEIVHFHDGVEFLSPEAVLRFFECEGLAITGAGKPMASAGAIGIAMRSLNPVTLKVKDRSFAHLPSLRLSEPAREQMQRDLDELSPYEKGLIKRV